LKKINGDFFSIKMKKVLVILLISLLTGCVKEKQYTYFVEGVSNPQISLNGIWEINTDHIGELWKDAMTDIDWKGIQVPGECMMQGFAIKHDKPFYYRKYFTVPRDFDKKIVKLSFDGVYSYAKVWINGHFVRDHSGGFTSWECDITPFVTAGDTACLIMEVTDKADEISYASGYAKHPIGGILRDVSLLAFPVNYPENIHIVTDLDEFHKDAILEVSGNLTKKDRNADIRMELSDPEERKINLDNSVILLDDSLTFRIRHDIDNPVLWDSEHPNLYKLKIIFSVDNNIIWYKIFKIGFREIEVQGNKLLVNGMQVKLRGVCRHDIHPLLGRVSAPDYELKDVLLAKEANINFIRTSHYPPTDHFLSLCDEYGLYVEDESAVCFVGSHRTAAYYPGASENSGDFTERYLSQLEEMVQNHRNHPSVIIWSLGNESSYGNNFKKSYYWVKRTDPTRPIIFSYPGLVPDGVKNYDILSMHYPGVHGNLEQYGKVTNSFTYQEMPVIFDEWAHVPCYNSFTLQEDPNIRDFWGISLDSMWQNLFNADGGTGGAIWGMIDETFMIPDTVSGFGEWWGVVDENVIPSGYSGTTVGYGEWGILDTWRRKKPEFWNTKKAYSPVRFLCTTFKNYIPGDSLSIPVLNRFDHTNFNELKIILTCNNRETRLNSFDLEPHAMGTLIIPTGQWKAEEPAYISFYDTENNLIDTYRLQKESLQVIDGRDTKGKIVEADEDENQLTISCENNTRIIFDKSTGLISRVETPDDTFILSGPYLNLRTIGRTLAYTYSEIKDWGLDWNLESFSFKKSEDVVVVTTKGNYTDIPGVEFTIYLYPDKIIETRYSIEQVPEEYIREIGIKWISGDQYDSLYWDRETYWSTYPAEYISAMTGRIALYSSEIKRYREEPSKNWVYDTKSFYYDGTDDEEPGGQLTNIARATKEDINEYGLRNGGREIITVVGNGEEDCRISKKDQQILLFINNQMDYVDLNWGNYQRNIKLDDHYTDEVTIRITANK